MTNATTNLIILFSVITIVNVILQTIKSIMTVKASWFPSALINCIAYGFYTIVIIYTNCEINMFVKAGITALANFFGVALVKLIEERCRKDKLWKIEVTIPLEETQKMVEACDAQDFSFGYQTIRDYTYFTFFCENKDDSCNVAKLLKGYHAKYFVTEQNANL